MANKKKTTTPAQAETTKTPQPNQKKKPIVEERQVDSYDPHSIHDDAEIFMSNDLMIDPRPFKRGDIYYIEPNPGGTIGAEMWAGRPAIIISNNVLNERSGVVQVIYLTSSQRYRDQPTPTRVPVSTDPHSIAHSTERLNVSFACVTQVTSVDTSRLGRFCGTASEETMNDIDDALTLALNLRGGSAARAVHKFENLINSRGLGSIMYRNEIDDANLGGKDRMIAALRQVCLNLTKRITAYQLLYAAEQDHKPMIEEVRQAVNNLSVTRKTIPDTLGE